jgi:hypothetical protein
MTPNATYLARKTFRTIDQNDQEIALEAGVLHVATKFDELICLATGEVVKLPLHIARNPGWYFHKVGDMGHPSIGPKVSHEDYTRELVRGNEGLESRCYWDLGVLEGWMPCENACATNASFTATLSKLGFEMRDPNGNVVKGVGHNRRNCTYHVKVQKKNRDGLFAA